MCPTRGRKMPKVSIIIPVYNAEKALDRCIRSVLEQDFQDFELLLIDDGSKDRSAAICDEAAARDSRVHVVHKANSGVSDTRNTALHMAVGEYCQFLDADDRITPEATSVLVKAAEESGADLVVADFYREVDNHVSRKGSIEENGLLSRNEYAEEMMKRPADYYYGVLWNKLYKRSIIEQHDIHMDPTLRFSEDFIFNMEYLLHTEKVYILRIPIYYYVKTEGSLVQQGMNLRKIIRMKLNVIDYYSDFYSHIYEPAEYEERKLDIYSFLIEYAHDDFALPGLPGTRKLGKERLHISEQPLVQDIWTETYYKHKEIENRLYLVSQQFDLTLREIKLLAFMRTFGKITSMHEVADYVGCSVVVLTALIDKLVLLGYLKLTYGLPQSAVLDREADAVIEKINEVMKEI